MNGLSGTRRSARPVRLSLRPGSGDDIGGAWWPYTGLIASELPYLIEALHPSFGEIVDICINWSATQGSHDLGSGGYGTGMATSPEARHRLMRVAGRSAETRLLVVPHMTSQALGAMVLRRASARPVTAADADSPVIATADTVVRAARAQSAAWAAS